MLRFTSIQQDGFDPELSDIKIEDLILEGGSNDVGVVISLSQVIRYNICMDSNHILGFTQIVTSESQCKSPLRTVEIGHGSDNISRDNDIPANVPDIPISLTMKMHMIEKGRKEMDEVNFSLMGMLEELE